MEKEMKLKRMSEIDAEEVKWLWYPYIPFGKITIIQGDPGEGKTTLGLRLAAACSNGDVLPNMKSANRSPSFIRQPKTVSVIPSNQD